MTELLLWAGFWLTLGFLVGMAFNNALGYEVEKSVKFTPVANQIAENEFLCFGQSSKYIKMDGDWFDRDPIVSYKLTKNDERYISEIKAQGIQEMINFFDLNEYWEDHGGLYQDRGFMLSYAEDLKKPSEEG